MFPRDRNLYGVFQPTGRKDRHSKVLTSKGPRDRRMRLSIETAIKFYDLQDRLDLDRPSKTLEWLLQKARPAIHELSHSTSDANVCQSSSLSSSMNPKNPSNKATDFHEKSTSWKGKRETSSSRYFRSATVALTSRKRGKAITQPIVRKESRTKARERARERTRLKCSAKQNLKVLPQQRLSESLLLQGPLDSSSPLNYLHNQETFQLSSSQDEVINIQSNVRTSSEISTGLQPTGFQQDFPCTTGFPMENQVNCSEFSSDGQFFCNQEILQDLEELDNSDIYLRSFVESPQACGTILANAPKTPSCPSFPYPFSHTLLNSAFMSLISEL